MKNEKMITKLIAQGYKVWNEKRIYINDASKKVNVDNIKKEGFCDIAKIGNVEMFLNGAGRDTLKTLQNDINVYYDIEKDEIVMYINNVIYNEKFKEEFKKELFKSIRE